jgi:hypothetical protein
MTAPCATPVIGPPSGSFSTIYFGKPGSMTKLRLPDAGYDGKMGRGEVAHALPTGGTTVTRRRRTKRVYTIPYTDMRTDDAEALVSYYTGSRGLGPFCLLDPAWRNQLSLDASTFDAGYGSNTVWNAPAADTQLVLDSTFTPPIVGSAVGRWSSPVNGHYLFEGTNNGGNNLVPSATYAVPYLTDQPAVVSIYARSQTSTTNVTLYALGLAAAGWDGVSFLTAACALTTTWARFFVYVPAATWTAANAPYIGVAVKAASGGGVGVLLANAQIEYGYSSPQPWLTGLGVPRCSLSAGLGGQIKDVYWRRNHSLIASEN